MSDTPMAYGPQTPFSSPPQLSGIDARVSALEHSVDNLRSDFASLAREIREQLNRPKDWGSMWSAVGIGVTTMLAGIGALYTVMVSADDSLSKDLHHVQNNLLIEVQKAAAVEKAALLESRLAMTMADHQHEMDQERALSETKTLLKVAFRN